MAEISITYGDPRHAKGSIKLNKFAKKAPQLLAQAFDHIGQVLVKNMKENLSGESHVLYPGNSNPFPGVIHGRLRASVNYKLTGQFNIGSIRLEVGPNTNYAETVNDLYPFVVPTWYESEERIAKILDKFLDRSVR